LLPRRTGPERSARRRNSGRGARFECH
jgi:hypothetical protein